MSASFNRIAEAPWTDRSPARTGRSSRSYAATILTRHAVLRTSQTRDDVAELAVVHVEASREEDAGRIDVQLVAVEHVRVQDGRDEVVRGADRMDVAGEVEVDFFHREDLGPPAARRAAFRPEHGTERRFADRN